MRKIKLYIVSLWLLFILMAIKEFVVVSYEFDFSPHGAYVFLLENIVSTISIILLIVATVFYTQFSYLLRGSTKLPKTIVKIEDQNYEHLTFLTTYIIPFLRVKMEGRDLLITVLLLVVIGAIFIQTNLFYKNPTLALLGYRLYKADTKENSAIILISKQLLQVGDVVHHIHLKDNIYFAKK